MPSFHMNNSHHEALYEALFDTTPDGIMIVSEDGRTIELNASMCRFLRAPRETARAARDARRALKSLEAVA